MNRRILQEELVKIADSLDNRGFKKEADMVDRVLRQAAGCVPDYSVKGKFYHKECLPPGEKPTPEYVESREDTRICSGCGYNFVCPCL